MEVALSRDGEGPELARVVKRLRDKYGISIGTDNDNPIMDSRIFEVEYPYGHRESLAANAVAENLFAQVDDEGHRSVLQQEIVSHSVNGREGTIEHVFIISHNGRRRKKETTLQWKDGSTT